MCCELYKTKKRQFLSRKEDLFEYLLQSVKHTQFTKVMVHIIAAMP